MLFFTSTSHGLILLLVKHHLFCSTAIILSDNVFEECFLHLVISSDLVFATCMFLHAVVPLPPGAGVHDQGRNCHFVTAQQQ